MRLFVAIRFREELSGALASVQEQLRVQGIRGNMTPRQNFHLTLAFIGEYPDAKRVLRAMQTVSFSPFTLRLNGLGSFGSLWWAGVDGGPALKDYTARLRRALADAGIPVDPKPFRPHITLIRQPSVPQIPLLVPPPAVMTVQHISLMRSDRGPGGMIYTEIGTAEGRVVF